MHADPAEFDNNDALDQLTYEIILLTRYGVQNTPTRNREAIMDRSALILLARLDAQGPMTVNELAEGFGLNVSTIHRQLKAAITNGLIEVVEDPASPAKLHRPTTLGKEKLQQELQARQQDLSRILEGWDPEDIKLHTEFMRKHNESLENYLDLKWPRP
ncbi:MarR family winged helix-turn-helix transcriptional regulator [Corynebacterium crudilactis]|uniref:MarR family transcriptional regulator n=1 Tax=Corynebacterium crudilactis TaxID=1652495 RepID=A0A172QSI6_9CORY|nr:MarR family winged helix-turn-helix transcriptional regulator [Corynebacterium crudilactis]ANE03657.1 MarR family transcriptional regulator [Corynebacterium crudilactis]